MRRTNQVFKLNTSFNHNISAFAELCMPALCLCSLFLLNSFVVYGPVKHKFNSNCVLLLSSLASHKLFLGKWSSDCVSVLNFFCSFCLIDAIVHVLVYFGRSFFGHQKEIINTLPSNYRYEWRIQHTKSRRRERAKKRTLTISQCFIWLVDMMTTRQKMLTEWQNVFDPKTEK